jgi:hypothetical protein
MSILAYNRFVSPRMLTREEQQIRNELITAIGEALQARIACNKRIRQNV